MHEPGPGGSGAPPAVPRLAAIVLAGGASVRMGRPKALIALEGRSFLQRILDTLRTAGLADPLVVSGHHNQLIREHLAGLRPPVPVVTNPRPAGGQLSSLLVGLSAIEHRPIDAVLVALVDHPLVHADTVRRLLDVYARERPLVVRPAQGGRHGHPVIFDRTLFARLHEAARDPAGAKTLVRGLGKRVRDVEVDDPGAFADIDTPADLARAAGLPTDS